MDAREFIMSTIEQQPEKSKRNTPTKTYRLPSKQAEHAQTVERPNPEIDSITRTLQNKFCEA